MCRCRRYRGGYDGLTGVGGKFETKLGLREAIGSWVSFLGFEMAIDGATKLASLGWGLEREKWVKDLLAGV